MCGLVGILTARKHLVLLQICKIEKTHAAPQASVGLCGLLATGRELLLRHSGARRSREPGIHTHDRGYGFSDVQLHIKARAAHALRCAIAHRGMTRELSATRKKIMPVGQISKKLSIPSRKNISLHPDGQISGITPRVSPDERGVRTSRTRGGMRWTRMC
jgi:hypothetical protein